MRIYAFSHPICFKPLAISWATLFNSMPSIYLIAICVFVFMCGPPFNSLFLSLSLSIFPPRLRRQFQFDDKSTLPLCVISIYSVHKTKYFPHLVFVQIVKYTSFVFFNLVYFFHLHQTHTHTQSQSKYDVMILYCNKV